jgi:hypothetical protein
MDTNPGAVGSFRKFKEQLAVINNICCEAKSPACLNKIEISESKLKKGAKCS